jgi:lipoprotein-releasing system ATP-binding protein
MSKPVLKAEGIAKTYRNGPDLVTVWQDIDLLVMPGESVSIVGASGSGKTSLLNVLGGLDSFDSGSVEIAGQSLNDLSEAERTRKRNSDIGFVYQFHHLLPEFTALENVMMPLQLRGEKASVCKEKARLYLQRVGLGHREDHKPSEMSGGERQRTAIARALVGEPKLVLLDEPTGNLDQQTAEQVENVLIELSENVGTAFVIVTHDEKLAARADRRFRLQQLTLTEQGNH